MSRIAWVLTALSAVLVAAVWYLFLFSPTSDEIEAVRADAEQARTDAADLRAEAATLRVVREAAPEAEAAIAAGQSILPEESSMPALIRQLQTAADEADVTLVSVGPSAPTSIEAAGTDIVSIAVQLQIEGTYFQIVDFSRRIEDPGITARGVKWRNTTIQPAGESDEGASSGATMLTGNISGEVFARSGHAASAPAVEGGAPPPEEGAGSVDEDSSSGDGDVTNSGDEPAVELQPADDIAEGEDVS